MKCGLPDLRAGCKKEPKEVINMKKEMRNFLIAVLAVGTMTFSFLQPVSAAEAQAGVVNINTASAQELETLNGVGPATASRILEYRQEHGGFKSAEELVQVRGIGEKKYEKMKQQISI